MEAMAKVEDEYTPEQRALLKQVAESSFFKKAAADLRKAIEDEAAADKARKRIDRYQAIRDGQIPPRWMKKAATKPKPIRHQPLPVDRAKQAIPKAYPGGTDGISTVAIHKKLATVLADENKQLGVKALSYDTVARALGRRPG
jgi:hypothetical protein